MITNILRGASKNCTHISTYAEQYAKALASYKVSLTGGTPATELCASRRPLGQALFNRSNLMGGAM